MDPAQTQSAQGTLASASGTSATAVVTAPVKKKDDGTSPDGIIVDKNKSAEQYLKEIEGKYIVPALVRQKFPDLIKLIYETESMNFEEREYWLQIMPIMTEDQIVKFRDILVNEKEQLAKLDTEYKQEVGKVNKTPVKEISEAEMKGKLQEIKQAETKSKEEEKTKEEDILKQINEG